jgi:hypothetical protein
MSEDSNTHRKRGGQPPRAPKKDEDGQIVKRRAGGQPGNHNALKHGRYIAKENLPAHHFSEVEQITVIDHLIRAIKRQMDLTYQAGMKIHSHKKVIKTMNSLSLAAIGLCRLMHLYDRMTRAPISPNFDWADLEQDAAIAKLLASYGKGSGSSLVC